MRVLWNPLYVNLLLLLMFMIFLGTLQSGFISGHSREGCSPRSFHRFALNIPWDLPRLLITLGVFIALLKKVVDILWVVLVGTGISLIVL
jgi:hypothetical protein